MPAIIPINNSDYNHYLRAALSIPLLANIQVLWIHLIITKPSDKYLHQRLPGPRCWIRVAPAILLGAIADHLTPLYVLELENYFINLADFFDGNDILDPAGNLAIRRGHKLGLMGLIPFFVTSMATLPARTMFIRIAASMLPDDDEPIWSEDLIKKNNLAIDIRKIHLGATVDLRGGVDLDISDLILTNLYMELDIAIFADECNEDIRKDFHISTSLSAEVDAELIHFAGVAL
ncbi:hypothetical protein AbraIFM66951_006272 [Aspergillus brasiliensis]|uniref:Uncharacterized protein n=1 Tax=Aspergillus brasiliensis TaxID=319629 RepID=A0A9W6DSV9_9EURO|nr:hypothetical protein AbraCBS73388_005469 [Aspergillus brasiliensis]GKZ51622.1 hypothetical protein AbraIFM66951_006272 [Aspergillus brasiliensis]